MIKNFREQTHLGYIAILRILIGFFFLMSGISKYSSGFLQKPILKGVLQKWAEGNPNIWYKSFLLDTAIPNYEIFAYLVVYGEILVGFCLLLGLLTRISSAFGIFMNINFLLGNGWSGPANKNVNILFIALQIIFIASAAGRSIGADGILKKRFSKIPIF
ncbi:MAG: TQO small subunit DoxD [Nitrospirota bacterium]|jgi:thiosulfate dehydrogenase [quinone] large subunit